MKSIWKELKNMDKSAIKNFAVNARKKLKEQIEQKAYSLGITKGETKKPVIHEDTFEVNGNKYEKRSLKHRDSLVSKINEKGYEQVIEEVAYTWFNRLIAIRFMEVNEYLPTGVRVLSSTYPNKAEPDVIRESLNIDLALNRDLIYKLQDENKTEELFKYILIKQCNELGKIMPIVFEEIEDYTELLLPDNLLQEGSIIRDLVTSIVEDDWKEQVEIIGWLYQYYISEKKDEVFEGLKKNVKITKENIPAATQLFTPDWIVKYMVENSLGRLWLESHPNEELKSKWKYYLEEAEQEPEVMQQLQVIREENKELKPEDIKFLDPAMGSGHILVYAFDVLYDIYKSSGYSEREIPKLILKNNLYGLDIDDRAAQLAYFAVMMKARSYSRRIFREKIDLNMCSIQESNDFPKEAIDFLVNSKETEIEKRIHRDDVAYLIKTFNDAKEYGSILEIKEINFSSIERRIDEIRTGETANIFELQYRNSILERIPALLKQAMIINQKYDVVIANPPYMGGTGMNNKLKKYVEINFKDTKNDMFAVFIDRCVKYTSKTGFIAMVTMHSWMFLSSYQTFREKILSHYTIDNLVHLGMEAFEGIIGKVVQTVAFVLRNELIPKFKSVNIRLVDYYDSQRYEKEKQFFNVKLRYANLKQIDYEDIEGWPIAYWISKNILAAFKNSMKLNELALPRQGIATGDNEQFLRLWHEIDFSKIGFNCESTEEFHSTNFIYAPYNKGGNYRKWYGNIDYVIKFDKDNYNILLNQGNHLPSRQFYFKSGITWSDLSTVNFGARLIKKGIVFDAAGPTLFVNSPEETDYIFSYINSNVFQQFLNVTLQGLHYSCGVVGRLPIRIQDSDNSIINITVENTEISKKDWDSFETSFEFKKHPIMMYKNCNQSLSQGFYNWQEVSSNNFKKLKINETKLNEFFIKVYGLQDELNSDVDDKDVTIRKADYIRDIKSFISYSVGCMFGRYSLDEEGLIYAGGEFNVQRYKIFKVDTDNVIPITDDEYFEDDIVSRFIEFVKITFCEETLEENLDFIADTLGKKGNETSRQTIRRYFLKDFYKDHLQTYQKKPIFWLFDSGKNDGFKALIYMHRYDIGNVARVRTDYLHLLQRKHEAEINRLDMVMESNASARDKGEARKKKEKIQKQIEECKQYDQVIAHVANQKISINLDDGVSVNYDKFQGIEVPQGEGRKPFKADLLAKIK